MVNTGDTLPYDRIKLFAERTDLLIHEATYLNSDDRGDSCHSTVKEACKIAKNSKVKLLALFHRAFRYTYDGIPERDLADMQAFWSRFRSSKGFRHFNV